MLNILCACATVLSLASETVDAGYRFWSKFVASRKRGLCSILSCVDDAIFIVS